MEQKIENKENVENQVETEKQALTHLAIPVQNLQKFFELLKGLKGISFPEGQELLDLIQKDGISLSLKPQEEGGNMIPSEEQK